MIRQATPADVPTIAQLIRDLAEYEKLSDCVQLVEADLGQHLFGVRPYADCLIAEDDTGTAVGFALYFFTYSTFRCKPTLYLEDLFVKPAHRGQGFGKSLFQTLARLAEARQCARMEWSVLDWNTSAIHFYESLGAKPVAGWTVYRLTDDSLVSLARN